MEENIDYYDGNDYDWVKPALMKQTFKYLKELYALLNDTVEAKPEKYSTFYGYVE